jgi:hypothetical protein
LEEAMAEIEIRIPDNLGLSEDELKQLREKLQSQLVETMRVTQAQAVAGAKDVEKTKVEVAKSKEKEKVIQFPF